MSSLDGGMVGGDDGSYEGSGHTDLQTTQFTINAEIFLATILQSAHAHVVVKTFMTQGGT